MAPVHSPKWKACSQANFPILESFQIFPFEFIKNHISANELRELRIVFQIFFGVFRNSAWPSHKRYYSVPVLENCFLSICRLNEIRALKDTVSYK